MSTTFWVLIGLAIAISIAFPMVLVAVARTLGGGPDTKGGSGEDMDDDDGR